jgi:hypothetical protein
MTTHRVHDENGNFYLRKDGSNFYVYSEGPGPGGTPGLVRNFSYIGDPGIECSSTTAINFSWNAPLDNGGSAITGYSLRRIGVVADPSNTGSLYYGDPDTVETGFYNPCGGGDGGSNPITIGNVTSIEIEDWSCGVYSFQIAAINANGTGNYTPSDDSPSWATLNVGWTDVGADNFTISIAPDSITATYPTSTGCFPNYQNTSGTLYTYQGTTVSTYTGFSQGSLTFTRPATAGWYYVGNVVETWTDYSTTCTVPKAGCHPRRFYVP